MIVEQLQGTGLTLEVYGVVDGVPARSNTATVHRENNLKDLHDLLAAAGGSYRALPREAELSAMFTTKDTASTGYKAALAIGSNCKIEVSKIQCSKGCSCLKHAVWCCGIQSGAPSSAGMRCTARPPGVCTDLAVLFSAPHNKAVSH